MLTACEASGPGSASLESDNAKASYGIGRDLGGNLAPAGERLDVDALVRGIEDAMAGEEPAVPQAEIQAALQSFSQMLREEQQAAQAAAAEENRQQGQEYMAENAEREDVQTTESGLQYEVIEEGDGPTPSPGDRVRIHYKGTLLDGTEFDSSYERGEPAVFGVGGVIQGFSEGLQLMPVGSTYRFVIPGDLAYGPQGTGGAIGPNETLIFEVELLGIEGDASGEG